MSYLSQVQEFQAMQEAGNSMEAFERYYDEDCVILEMATGEKREGKNAQRKAIQEWFGSVEEFHGSGSKSIMANEDTATTSTEVWFDCTFKGMGRMKMEEVAVQKWKGNKIIEERFYYNMPGK